MELRATICFCATVLYAQHIARFGTPASPEADAIAMDAAILVAEEMWNKVARKKNL
jgi:hypothetical protein